MKKHEIKVGGHYRAKVSGVLTTVRVDAIRDDGLRPSPGSPYMRYDVTNLHTGRTTTFRSAAKFRAEVNPRYEKCEGGCGAEYPQANKPWTCMNCAKTKTPHQRDEEERYEVCAHCGGSYAGTCDCYGSVMATRGQTTSEPDVDGDAVTDPTPLEARDFPLGDPRNPYPEGEQRRPFPTKEPAAETYPPSSTTATTPAATPDEPADPLGLKGDQRPAFDLITARVARGERVTKLCGYAGTGKTYLLARLAGWALARNYEVTVAAPTHKAAGVIADKLADAGVTGVEVQTIHSLLGLTLAPDMENDTGGRVLVSPEAGKGKLTKGLVICDEASMVGTVLKEHIDRTPPSVRWLFVGDLAQLPPVGEGVSELLDEPDAVLETVLRQARGSEILNLATAIRGGDLSMDCADGRDVYRVGTAEELLEAAHARFDSDDYRADPSHARVLVFRNARRRVVNDTMRALLVGSPDPYTPGEWLVMYAAFTPEKSRLNVMAERARGYAKGTPGYGRAWREFFRRKESLPDVLPQLHVSEEVRVTDVGDATVRVAGADYGVYQLTVTDHEGAGYELPVLTAESAAEHKAATEALVEAAQGFRAEMAALPHGSAAWRELDDKRRALWGAYYTLEETFAQVDYSYCMTVHKSQGSTFAHAFVDVPDLLSSGGMQQRILYTAVTRPSKSLTFYN